jgi:hypothetical protein
LVTSGQTVSNLQGACGEEEDTCIKNVQKKTNCCNCNLKEDEQHHPSTYRGFQGGITKEKPKSKHGNKRQNICNKLRGPRTVLRSGAA